MTDLTAFNKYEYRVRLVYFTLRQNKYLGKVCDYRNSNIIGLLLQGVQRFRQIKFQFLTDSPKSFPVTSISVHVKS